jgi:glutaredoxin
MVYFEGTRNGRELERTKELLESHGIAYKLLDVSGDEACQAFVTQQAKCDLDKLPVTFVAGQAVGPYPDLVAFDVAGHLRRSVFG